MPRVTDMGGRPASGFVQMPVIGIVVDNVDKEGLGRVKVKFPTLPEQPESFWLRQMTPNGGKGNGLYALPEKEDEVLVMFLQGNQDNGVILGQFWNGKEKPPEEKGGGMPGSAKSKVDGSCKSKATVNDGSSDIEKNDRRYWKSRSGHMLVFDDTDGKETIQIWDSTQKLHIGLDSKDGRIVIANNEGDTHIRSKKDIYFESAEGNIFLRAKENIDSESKEDTLVKAKNIEAESKLETKLKVGTNLTIDVEHDITMKCGGNCDVKGKVVKVKSTATSRYEAKGAMAIKGKTIAIN